MKHIIKWRTQAQKRSLNWIKSIHNARVEIRDIQEETPLITDETIAGLWDRAFDWAIAEAEEEMGGIQPNISSLTWKEVFDDEYLL